MILKGPPTIALHTSPDWVDYTLLDCGNGRKLERFGRYKIIRPEHNALWQPALLKVHWSAADAEFAPGGGETGGGWHFNNQIPRSWEIGYKSLRLQLRIDQSRQIGVFPEQAAGWDWIGDTIRKGIESQSGKKSTRILNLFGYTGMASLAAAAAGAQVTHIDASKKAIKWAQMNQTISKLSDLPIRWLVDDAEKFVRRELRRGVVYEGIILDPPIFGRGPRGNVWRLFESLQGFLDSCRKLLSAKPLLVFLTAYGISASSMSLQYAIEEMVSGLGGNTESGELALIENSANRVLSLALFARWSIF